MRRSKKYSRPCLRRGEIFLGQALPVSFTSGAMRRPDVKANHYL